MQLRRIFIPALLAMLVMVLSQPALADRAFTQRYTVNQNGDMVLIGNTLLTCVTGAANCAAAQAGGNFANNDFTPMAYVDIDGNANTFNSSSANLTMPGGATVTFAGLYWGAISADPARNQVLFRTPTAFGYGLVNASVIDTNASVAGFDTYQGFADVTAQVQAGGSGTYTVANVQSGTANLYHAGWTLVVVYASSTLPLRNFTVFDGFVYSPDAATPVSMTVSGFLTPLNGPITTRLGVVAYDGDLDATSDVFQFNGTNLSDPANPTANFYNSSISDLGVTVTSKSPHYVNQLGFDIDRTNVPASLLTNGATSAVITASGGATERIWLGLLTFSTDLHVPIVVTNVTKTATDVNGGALLAGDILRWTITMSNTGYDTANNLVLTDPIPAGTTYVPGSLDIVTGANNAIVQTDASGDDQSEYFSAGPARVVFRLGSGANSTTGGSLPLGAATQITFDTTVNSGLAAGTVISNQATISYTGQTIGDTYGATSGAATATVQAPPTITKSFAPNPIASGGVSVLTIVIANAATNPTTLTGVTFTDTYPSGLVNTGSPNPQIACTAGSTAGTLSGGAAGGNSIGLSAGATLLANGSCTITVNVTAAAVGLYVNATGAVTSTNGGTGGTATATLSVGKPSIAKSFAPASILSGGTSTMSMILTNPGGTALNGVAFSDAMTNITVAASPAAANTCGGSFEGRTGLGAWGALAGGNTEVRLTGGVLAGNASCTLSVAVTGTVTGVHPNTTTGVSSTESGTAGSASNTASLTVVGAPVITKSFSPSSVRTNTPSTMTITVTNPNTTTAITGVAFTDTYPANVGGVAAADMLGDTPANATLNCTSGSAATLTGGANGGNTVGVSGVSLPPNGSCTVTVNVESAVATDYPNTTGTVTSTNAGTGTAASATLNVTNLTAPTVTKAFGAASISTVGSTSLTITLTNTNAGSAVNGVSLTDVFPSGLAVSSATTSNTCGGSFQGRTGSGGTWGTIAVGNTEIRLSGGTINAGAGTTCAISVSVSSPDGGLYNNTTGPITTSNAGSFGPALASLNVLAPPRITKSFAPDAVATSAFSLMTITLSNPTTATASLTGVGVLDNFPANLIVQSLTGQTNSCGGTVDENDSAVGGDANFTLAVNDRGIRLGGVTLAPNATCSVSVRVASATAGNYTNTTGAVTSTNGGTGLTATAALAVGRPDINKAFGTSPIAAGGTSVLTFSLVNPTATDMITASFTDDFPAGMSLVNTTVNETCTGTVTAESRATTADTFGAFTAGHTSVRFSGFTIQAADCTIAINVTSTTTGTNSVAAGALSTSAGVNANPATATLQVYNRPTALKAFSPTTVTPGVASTLSITLSNTNAVAATTVALTDVFPSGLVVATTPSATNTCGGTYQGRTGAGAYNTIAAGNTDVRLSGTATIPANGSCVITVNVSSATPGNYLNTTGPVTTANIGSATASTATLTVMAAPTVAKSFSPATIATNASSTLSITLTNPNTVATTGAAFTDTYPANVVNAATPAASTNCAGATVTATAGGNSLAVSGATIPASGSCTVTVVVTSASAGSYANSTGTVTTTNSGTGAAASGTLTVLARPTLTKSFGTSPIAGGVASLLTITLSNSNAATALTSVAFTDVFPTIPGAMTVASPLSSSNTCGGTLDEDDAADGDNTLEVGDGSIRLTGGTIAASSSCVITISVTASTGGIYTNFIAAGALTSSGGSNAAAASSNLTVTAAPSLIFLKTVQIVSDPVNNTTNPKNIPGAVVDYTLRVTNTGSGTTTADTVVITDPIPANTDLFVGDLGATPTDSPVAFVQGTPTSGLTFNFVSLSDTTDDIGFFTDAACTTAVTPTAPYDASIRCMRLNPKGTMAGIGGGNPYFDLRFRVRVR